MAEAPQDVVETIDIAADRAAVWRAVSDPAAYRRWSPEAAGVRRPRHTPADAPWAVGDTFVGANRVWVPWATTCRVVAADEVAGEFAFEVGFGPVPVSRWAYEIEGLAEGGTRVRERWTDRRSGVTGAVIRPSGVLVGRGTDAASRNRDTMRVTLARLKADLER